MSARNCALPAMQAPTILRILSSDTCEHRAPKPLHAGHIGVIVIQGRRAGERLGQIVRPTTNVTVTQPATHATCAGQTCAVEERLSSRAS